MCIEEREDVQAKIIDKIPTKIIAEKFQNLNKEMVINIQKALRIQSTQDQKKKNFSGHIIIKTLGI
jgi:hypothetical protein